MSGTSPLKTRTEAGALRGFMESCARRVESALDRRLPPAGAAPAGLHRAMRYAALAGGKYVRPVLVYATGAMFDRNLARLDSAACAVELVHVYSLVHDDLPAMDDDTLRRGKPSCHVAFGEATAILAGDALQALAFDILASDQGITASTRLRMVETLAGASGSLGMAGGQAIDLASIGHPLTLPQLEDMHVRKTGALIRASVLLGALGAGCDDETLLSGLDGYARCIGLAFQIRDDVLDVEGETAVIGKTGGSDRDRGKPTYCSVLGIEGARSMASQMHEQAIAHLRPFGDRAGLLVSLASFIVQRDH